MHLIKICAYSHVTIKQTAVVDYQIEVTFISMLILKAIDSTEKSKRFSSQFFDLKHLKAIFAHARNEKGTPLKEASNT